MKNTIDPTGNRTRDLLACKHSVLIIGIIGGGGGGGGGCCRCLTISRDLMLLDLLILFSEKEDDREESGDAQSK
jgi:hypothetical protein